MYSYDDHEQPDDLYANDFGAEHYRRWHTPDFADKAGLDYTYNPEERYADLYRSEPESQEPYELEESSHRVYGHPYEDQLFERPRVDIWRSTHFGKGPRNYQRKDERIQEDVIDALTHDPELDAREIEATVQNGEVTLTGQVADRAAKWLAEEIVSDVYGVRQVFNRLVLPPVPQRAEEKRPNAQ